MSGPVLVSAMLTRRRVVDHGLVSTCACRVWLPRRIEPLPLGGSRRL